MQFHIMACAEDYRCGCSYGDSHCNGVVKEDIAAKLEVHGAYSPGQ